MPSLSFCAFKRRFSRSKRIFILLGFTIAVGILFSSCSPATTNGRVVLSSDGTWQASLALPGGGSEPGLVEPILQAITEGPIAARQEGNQLILSGQGGMDQLRSLLFDEFASLTQPFSPQTEMILMGKVVSGETIALHLESSPSTGYAWQVTLDPDGILHPLGEIAFTSKAQGADVPGAPAVETVEMVAQGTGTASARLVYRREWEPDLPIERRLEVQAPRLADLSDLSNPAPLPVGLDVPGRPSIEAMDATTLPAHFDWREETGIFPPIRNQGACGSCWAFAAVGALETNIALSDGVVANLSEQYLVSCNTNNWNCVYGGGTAHSYHYNYAPPGEFTAGAVSETAFPYTGQDSPCTHPNSHSYLLDGYAFIPYDVVAIKQAIYQYGPVKASVCVGSAFQAYRSTSGIFAKDESSVCGGSTNHAIVLTGWDDTQGPNGIWYLRNSWGTWWGEAGYMRIDRKVSSIGRNASYIIYRGGPPKAEYFFYRIPLIFR